MLVENPILVSPITTASPLHAGANASTNASTNTAAFMRGPARIHASDMVLREKEELEAYLQKDPVEVGQEIMDLLKRSQESPYIGEAISQREHMLQAAYHAKEDGFRDEVVLAALLHDIGHICADESAEQMGDPSHGVAHHEDVGGMYLRIRGFSEDVIALVAAHVDAKRYLTYIRGQEYYNKLSDASRFTLSLQGGPMTPEEARLFEHDPLLKDKLEIRYCDERAKVSPHPEDLMPNTDAYVGMIAEHLRQQRQKRQTAA